MMSAVKTATTNEDGEFTISGLGPTSLAIVAEHEIHGRSATLALAATTESAIGLQLPLLAPGVVEGTVLLDGQPAESTRVTAQSQNVPSATFSVRTGSDGKYRFDILAPDQYLISARVGDPRSGFATSSRATTVESGTTASVDLAIVRGKVTLVVSAIGEGVNFAIVYVIEGPFAATNAQALEAKLANRDSGFSSMSIVFGGEPAWVENLLPAQYTVCALAFPEEIVGRAMFEYLGREAERLPVVCKDTAVAASPKEQEISIDVIVPTFVPITPIEPQQ